MIWFDCSGFWRRVRCCVVGAAGLGALAAQAAWPDASYTYYADRKPMAAVLQDFAAGFGLTLDATPRVRGVLNGRIQTASPPEFLDRLGAASGFVWFLHEGVLHVSHIEEQSSQQFLVSGANMPAIKGALKGMGLLDDRFGWSELPTQGLVVVSGPAAYLGLVAAALAKFEPSASDWRVAVFRLRHARVDDRVFQERDREVVTPGVATLLRSLMSGIRPPAGARSSVAVQQTVTGGLPAAAAWTGSADATKAAPPVAAATGGAGVVESDVRLNAIIVRDAPHMIPVYEQIVRQLDTPTSLIQIEAMIVDISKDRLKDLGIDWTISRGRGTASFGADGPGTISVSVGATSMVSQVQSLLARIRALEQVGAAEVLTQPKLLTMDNMAAMIDLSETFYTKVSSERSASLVPVTAGVKLKVTPHIIAAAGVSNVQLTIDIEDGALDTRDGIELPIVKRSVISTQAVIKAQNSLLIGGFNSRRNSRTEQRVPGLSSIPFIGHAFRTSTVVDSNRERLFLITPTVLANPVASEEAGVEPVASRPLLAPSAAPCAGGVAKPGCDAGAAPTRRLAPQGY
ncbi:type III secretion system outer membrane ring subunit SctC [Variovorax saccharolyticus]|uniref:type III secretion system outer membrane ring subunit SctC n=1 Tax=Variovorax saccharolyticus TaxID=3053516 RepID=UPI00257676BC|nr:type III secretion system outer membrane ring subunit SctC [Variovorax sp. J31P216]MDM0030176.1 type III secretion system outer membrane ring subunit SctC [Variovorax sp. J31P216]